MEGAAQKLTPVDENPRMVETPKRQSRRKRGLEPTTSEESENKKRMTREMRRLTNKGGWGGRINHNNSNWTYFSKTPVKKTRILDLIRFSRN